MVVKKSKKKKAKKKASPKKTRVIRPKIAPFDGVIFDMDNVLIDTRESYLEAIRLTVDIYLTHGTVPFYELRANAASPYLLTKNDVEQFKHLGGFNDDWDCCYGLLVYLLNLKVKDRSAHSLKEKINIKSFVKKVKTRPLGVSGIVKMLGRPEGVRIEKISRIFQEIYLGRSLFKITERQKTQYWQKRGLILKEKFIYRRSTMERLKKMGISLGIATGRPRFEALYALQQFKMVSYFEALTTMDEVKKAERRKHTSLRKPHPFSLIETAKKLGKNKRYIYVGDLPDDMIAAKRAQKEIDICGAAFIRLASNPKIARKQFEEVNPEFLLDKPGDLPKLLLSPGSYAFER